MALLQLPDFRRLLRRRKGDDPIGTVADTDIDAGARSSAATTQADGLRRAVGTTGNGDDARTSAVAVEPKLMVSSPRSRSMAELQRSYDQVMTLVSRIGDHLDVQAERQTRVDEAMDRLLACVDTLPQLSRQNNRLLELLSTHLERSDEREQHLHGALERLGGSAREQSEMLGMLHQQLGANAETSRTMAETLLDFRSTLGELGDSNRRAVDVLADMARAADRRETKLEQILGRTQKWMIAALVCCGAAAVTALVIALV